MLLLWVSLPDEEVELAIGYEDEYDDEDDDEEDEEEDEGEEEDSDPFNDELVAELQAAFKEAKKDPAVRCVLLKANGKLFSAGQDVTAFGGGEQVSFRKHLQKNYNPLIVQM